MLTRKRNHNHNGSLSGPIPDELTVDGVVYRRLDLEQLGELRGEWLIRVAQLDRERPNEQQVITIDYGERTNDGGVLIAGQGPKAITPQRLLHFWRRLGGGVIGTVVGDDPKHPDYQPPKPAAPDPGPGWRLLRDDERQNPPADAEYWSNYGKEWRTRFYDTDTPCRKHLHYRVPIKPRYEPLDVAGMRNLLGCWVRRVDNETESMVISFQPGHEQVLVGNAWRNADELLKHYVHVDSGEPMAKRMGGEGEVKPCNDEK